jgi:hypothetical protein
MGWFTVAAYGAAAVTCFVAAFRHPYDAASGETRHPRRMWIGIAVLMSFLCLNKQLDLQSLLTDIGRVLAIREGWYDHRRLIQYWMVLAMAMAGALILAIIAWKLRAILRERIVLLIGVVFLLTFIAIRAASFHHVDIFLGSQILGIRANWILELTGIGLITLSAVRSATHPKTK